MAVAAIPYAYVVPYSFGLASRGHERPWLLILVSAVVLDAAAVIVVGHRGAATVELHAEDQMGEIYMIGVDPDFQRRGIATRLTRHSIEWFRSAGMSIAMVETGGDDGHAPARRAYESSGFFLLPVARYFRAL